MMLRGELYAMAKAMSYYRRLRSDHALMDWQLNYASKLNPYKNIHKGEDCLILGNGPSLNKFDISRFNDYYVFGTNKIFLIFDKVNLRLSYHLSVNAPMIEQSRDTLTQGIGCTSFLSYTAAKGLVPDSPHIVRFYTKGAPWVFSEDFLHPISEGYTITFVALQLAYFMGFQRVFLFGVDHNFVQHGQSNSAQIVNGDDVNHFIPNYVTCGQKWQLADLEASEISYKQALYAYKKAGREIFDCTIDGRLHIFPKMDVCEALQIMKKK